jgi:hypothetical protein
MESVREREKKKQEKKEQIPQLRINNKGNGSSPKADHFL